MKKEIPIGSENPRVGQKGPLHDAVHGLHDKAQILKDSQKAEIEDAGGEKDKLPHPLLLWKTEKEQAEDPVHKDGREHDKDIDRFAPGIEDKACRKKPDILKSPGKEKSVINEEDEGQKI